MTTYGSKVYGAFRYGIGATTDISAYPFTTQSLDYGTIKLSWVYPSSSGDFTTFMIVRNASGFPITPDGGDLIYKSNKTALTTAGSGGSSLLGTTGTLTDTGSFYDPITGSAITTYTSITTGTVDASIYVTLTAANANIKIGQLVTYTASGYLTGADAGSGIIGNTTVAAINGTTLTLNKPAYIPSGTTLTFSPTFLTPGKSYYYSAFVYTNSYWQRVGTAMGTSIKDYNTANVMYNSLPQVYLSSSTSSNKNNDLYNLLRVIGVQYDLIKTKVENAKNRYDVNNLDGKLLPALMDQMGFSYESGLGIQQSRRMLSNADYIYLNKGTGQGVKQFVTSFTGYPATINPFKNLFLTLDCASFETSDGYWGTSGNAMTAVNTTPALEGGSPAAYSESNSPTGYANSRLGYLKATITSTAGSSAWELSYGTSPDSFSITATTTTNAADGYGFVTLTTTAEHGFSVGQSIVLQGMTPNYINGIIKIISVPSPTSFTFYNSAIAAAGVSGGPITVSPTSGSGTINSYNPVLYGIPVTGGTSYKFSFYGYFPTGREIGPGIKWYDQYGSFISTALGSAAIYDGDAYTWTNKSYTNAAPTYAAYGVPFIQIYNTTAIGIANLITVGDKYYFDAFQFEASPFATKYSDPRRVDLYLNAPRINQVINPGFELATTSWSTTGTSAFATDATAGNVYPTSSIGLGTANSTKSAKLTANAASTTLTPSSTIAISANTQYSFSAYVKGSNADTVTVSVIWKDSGGTTLQTDTSAALTLPTSTFSRLSLTPISGSTQMISPATATTATITLTFTGASTHIYYVDSILFESSAIVNAYFDGGTGYNNTDDLVWEQNAAGTKGTASTGRSFYYPNKFLTQNRLNAVLADYLPLGSTYAVFIGTTAT